MGYVILLVLICAAIVVAYFLVRRTRAADPPMEVFVCSECGMKDCICHKDTNTGPENP